MEFPIYRQKFLKGYDRHIKIAGPSSVIYVTTFHSGMADEIELDLVADLHDTFIAYPMESSAAEFTAAYEAVQQKITNAVKQ